jgi:hypothetical protein
MEFPPNADEGLPKFIQVRSCFRIAEYADGYGGIIMRTEWAFYCFDTIPLFLGILTFVFFWPPSLLNSRLPFSDGHALELTASKREDTKFREIASPLSL